MGPWDIWPAPQAFGSMDASAPSVDPEFAKLAQQMLARPLEINWNDERVIQMARQYTLHYAPKTFKERGPPGPSKGGGA